VEGALQEEGHRGSPFCYHPRPEVSSDTTDSRSRFPAAPLCPARRGDARLLPFPRSARRHDRLRRRGGPLAGGPPGGRRHAADHPSGRGVPTRDLAGRQDARLLGGLRGAHRGLYDAGGRRAAGAPHLRGGEGAVGRGHGGGVDAGRRGALRHLAPARAAEHGARPHRSSHRAAHRDPPGAGERGGLRAGRQDPLLHPLRLPGEPHQALQGGDRPEPLALQGRRRRGRDGSTSSPTATAP
jgi:hypothetical protein